MKPNCPNLNCSFVRQNIFVAKSGSYFRKDDSRFIQRFICQHCHKRFSSSTSTLEYHQKKRRINHTVFNLLSSGISLRRISLVLKINQKTAARKLQYLAAKARLEQAKFLAMLKDNPVEHLQFDDLITSEHTKLKPLAVSVAVDAKRRFILGLNVAAIPAFGKIAKLSRAKYGPRISEHKEKLDEMLKQIKPLIVPTALICSDEHKHYPPVVKKYFPKAKHERFKGGRGCIVGQGELKKLRFDPLFTLNHSCAMLRANINRLFRKTWCTTKKPMRLKDHLDIYIWFHNSVLLT